MRVFVTSLRVDPLEVSTFAGPRDWVAGRCTIDGLGDAGQVLTWTVDSLLGFGGPGILGTYIEVAVTTKVETLPSPESTVTLTTWTVEPER